jgi:Holliday junction resolvase
LVSNRIGADRERELLALLNSTGFDVRAALDRAARVAPGATVEQIEIERLGGEPTCTIWAARGDAHFEINLSMTDPSRVSVAQEHPAGEEMEGEDHLLRFAPPLGSVSNIPHLILGAAGG